MVGIPAGARTYTLAIAALLAASFGLLYGPVLLELVRDWATDDNYSHGFLIVPIAAYMAWERRDRLALAARVPSNVGLLVVGFSVFVLLAGVLGAELFLTRISMVGVITGAILFLFGWAHLRILAFPISVLLLMIPLPAIVFSQIAFPLQLLASRVGEVALDAAGIPVLREGNVMIMARTTLEVAEACSGIRSLISLFTLGIVFGYFADPRTWVRSLLAAATIPIAVFANAARVAGTGIAAHYYGPAAGQGFFHEFSGWLLFVFAFMLLFVVQRLIRAALPPPGVTVQASGPSVQAI